MSCLLSVQRSCRRQELLSLPVGFAGKNETLFAEAVQIAEERNVALYCGEYGVIDRAEPSDALKWYQAIHQVFEKYGIGRAAWSYREMDFGFTGEHFSGVLEQVIAHL